MRHLPASVPPVSPQHSPLGTERWAVAHCHFVACAADSLTASLTRRRDFISYIDYGPSQKEACNNAKNHLKQMLQDDRCTQIQCECKTAASISPQAGASGARVPNAAAFF